MMMKVSEVASNQRVIGKFKRLHERVQVWYNFCCILRRVRRTHGNQEKGGYDARLIV